MIKELIRESALYQKLVLPLRSLWEWRGRQFAGNSPQFVKQNVLVRHGIHGSTWVETGTYRGTTTRFLVPLSEKVYTIEPEQGLYRAAVKKFGHVEKVEVINGVSEKVFPELLAKLSGNVSFWLDGHYSAGVTFKGDKDCPVEDELASIANNLDRLDRVSILVDDVRCFLPASDVHQEYPSIDFLVDWARENRFDWSIEHDIFIAKNYRSQADDEEPV